LIKRPRGILFALSCLLAVPLLAQPQIGGGTCSSSTLTGTYAFTLTGRQVTSSGNFTNVLQANGAATFDGQSAVSIKVTADTLQSVATPLNWTGTYSVRANCAGIVTITSGGSVTLNLVLYSYDNTGPTAVAAGFLVTGADAIYNYSGSGGTQPAACSAATLSGVYTFTGTGYSLSGSSVTGAESGTGLLQFDGVGSITANFNTSVLGKIPAALTLTGSYSISPNCVGSANLTDSAKNSYVMSFSITNASVANGAFDATLDESGKFMIAGSGHVIYGQPTTAEARESAGPLPGVVASLVGDSGARRGI
jgi:hypothetical protein